MPLREELAATGSFLFRWRSYLPLVVLALVVAERRRAAPQLDPVWEVLCIALAASGLAIRGYVVGHAPAGTSGRSTRGQVCEALNTTGAYSVVRHPLYVGNFLVWLGVSLIARNPWLSFAIVLVFWLYYERIMFAEEEFLRRKFKLDYLRWAQRTPAFVPSPGLFRRPELAFSGRTVLRREASSWFGVVVTFTLLELAGSVDARPVLDNGWAVALAAGSLGYGLLRSLKRHTRVLNAPGR